MIRYPSPPQAEGEEGKRIGKLHDRDVLCDQLKYYRDNDSDLSEKIVNDYEHRKLSLMDLINELDEVNDSDINTDFTRKEKGLRQDILKTMISQKLDISSTVGYFVDVADELFELMSKDIEELKKSNTHRHRTILGLYTEKQVY